MVRSALGKVAWVGRTASMVFGLALVMALVLGVASMALGANGKPFLLGKRNVATLVSTLVNKGPGPALSLKVGAGQPPLAVNSSARVANLNAATAGRADSAASAGFAANANTLDNKDSSEFLGETEKAADADQLDGKDSTDFASGEEAPGFDSFTDDGKWGLRSDIQDAASVSVTAPSDGFVILSGDGSFQLNHVQNSSGITTYAQVSLSDTSRSLNFDNLTDAGVSSGSPSGSSHIPFGITRAFPVTAGEHTFYLTAKFTGPSGSDVLVTDPTLTGFFVKNRF